MIIIRRHAEGHGHLISRYDDPYETGSDTPQPDTTASRNRIIIGVVVGGVAAIAITAAIFFVLLKKRKWDRIKRHEEQLLAMHASATYHKSSNGFSPADYSTMAAPPRPSSSSLMSYNPPPHQPRVSVESPPPSYQRLPAYDPLRYHRVSHLPSNVKPARGGHHTSSSSQGHGPSGSLAGLGLGSDGTSIPLASMGSQQIQRSRHSYQQDPRGPSPEGSMSVHSDDISAAPSGLATEHRPPRRPKPVLTRLVTSFV
ncbi:hypothetical protein FE257_008367 [Aspergillus nanangensis]|uniref:Uncharacterized protein n=1 Tax=Aspergillus nanangensis TaxID=2582783 RepID=A0AAD4GTM6_ASPNN|nr:hypothetical protein FE257_008367 [Aspergillus nanangensis]